MQLLLALVVAVYVIHHGGEDILHNLTHGNFATRIVIAEFDDEAAIDHAAALQYRTTAAPR